MNTEEKYYLDRDDLTEEFKDWFGRNYEGNLELFDSTYSIIDLLEDSRPAAFSQSVSTWIDSLLEDRILYQTREGAYYMFMSDYIAFTRSTK